MNNPDTNINNNVDELLEKWDWETGRPTGKPVSRAEAHKNGTPHEGVHLWIARICEGRNQLLFQKRSPFKSSYPDCLDITVGGHTLFGSTDSAIVREAYEEIGIETDEKQLKEIGLIRYEERHNGNLHREFQRVFLLPDNRPLDAFHFNDGEVTGICAVNIEDFRKMLNGEHRFTADYYDGREISPKNLSRSDFHPELFADSMKSYMEILIPALYSLYDSSFSGSESRHNSSL